MSFVSLYRKYRPQKFSDLVGQEQIVETLKNSLKYDRISHAYLFAGPRGTGKTSTAKVYARALNCEIDNGVEPCGECSNCRQISSEQSMDVIEIDAASNRGIDEIRDLREQVRYQPGEGAYRVYIIDEVHMLTDQAFNALLKTLEEPPSRVVFILATTEPHRIVSTVLSRCQRFDFTLLSEPEIADRLTYICRQEGVDYRDEALNLIAYSSNGGMRDAISILDQAISYCGDHISTAEVEEMLGKIDIAVLSELMVSFSSGDTPAALEISRELQEKGRSIDRIVADLLAYVRQIMLTVCGGFELAASGLSRGRKKKLKEDSEMFSRQSISKILSRLIELDDRLSYADRPDILLESALVELTLEEEQTLEESSASHLSKLKRRVDKLEEKLTSGEEISPDKRVNSTATEAAASDSGEASAKASADKNAGHTGESESAVSFESSDEHEKKKSKSKAEVRAGEDRSSEQKSGPAGSEKVPWNEIMNCIKEEDVKTHAKLKECLPPRLSDGKLTIKFTPDKNFHYQQAKREKQFIARTVREVMDRDITLEIRLQGEDKKNTDSSAPEASTSSSSDSEDSGSDSEESKSSLGLLEKLQKQYGGEIITVSSQVLEKTKGGNNNGYEKNDAESSKDAEADAAKAEGTGG